MTVLSSFIVRPAILQNSEPVQPQPLVCFILPESSTISHPFIPILVAVILPAEISKDYSFPDVFVFVENDFVATYPLSDEPFFDEKTNSFVWLFFGSYKVSEPTPSTLPLTLSAYALFEPNEPFLSAISAYDEFSHPC